MEQLQKWDEAALLAINGLHSSFGDHLMWLLSTKWFWIPAYLLIFLVLLHQGGWKWALLNLILVGIVILIADQTCSALLKPMIERLRPCHELHLKGVLHLVDGKCGGQFGFASSHAANFFALALFFSQSLGKAGKKWAWMMFACAGMVAFSRVYLGVHYPADVLAGMLIGLLAAWIGLLLRNLIVQKLDIPQVHVQ